MSKTKQLVLEALRRLAEQDPAGAFGPLDVAIEIRNMVPDSRFTGSLASTHLKGLMELELVERVPQGKRRGLYRLAAGE